MSLSRPVRLAAAVTTLALVGLTSCDEQRSEPPDEGLDYAALGDSFAAAPDLPTISTDNCHRSDHNFAHLVAKQLEDVELTDVSCGGASTADILQSQVQDDAVGGRVLVPQIGAVTAATDLVTLAMGVNDEEFVVDAVLGCLAMADSDRDGAPCQESNSRRIPRQLDKILANLVHAVDTIANRAPDARILLVGYPVLLDEGTSCPRRFPLADGDVAFVRESWEGLNQTIEAAAAEAGVEYVDVASASEGHGICAKDPWVNGDRGNRKTGAAAYHPTPAGQEGVAALILDLL